MKTNLDKFFKTDETCDKEGVWFKVNDETSFLLKPFRSNNPQLKAALANFYKPYARQIEMDTLPLDKHREIQIKMFNRVSLVDWKGVEIDGKPAECNPENATKLFMSLPPLFETLWDHANDFKNYKVEDVGNS